MIRRPEEALARLVLGRYLGIRPGETVTIETWGHALSWARGFVLEARRQRADPILVVEDEEAFFRSLALPRTRGLPGAPPALAARSDVYVYLPGPEEFPRLFGLSRRDLATVMSRHGPAWRRAARTGRLRAARIAVAEATPSAAARYGVDPATWARDVLRASLVAPGRLARAAEPIVRRLARSRRVRIRHANGTDLTVELLPHAWVVEDGRVDRDSGRIWTRVPAGRAAFALSLRRSEGTWEANRPSYDRYGHPPVSEGARFTFAGGRLREFAFERGGAAFASAFARGGRGREFPSALTFGLNPAVVRGPELDAIAAGTIGLLLGDNRAAGGHHRSRFSYLSTLHGADVEVDGRTWWRDGAPVSRPPRLRDSERLPRSPSEGERAGPRTLGAGGRPARDAAPRSARR